MYGVEGLIALLPPLLQAVGPFLALAERMYQEARHGDVGLVAVLLEEHPLQRGGALALAGWPIFRALGEVIEDGVGFEEMAPVGEADGRHLAVRVLGQEICRAGRAVVDVELDALELEAEVAQ